jgi:putative ABC transport system permease protein
MIKNYLKIALRNLLRNKMFSFINILGLAVGISVFTFIGIYITNELNYDKYNLQYNNIYRVIYKDQDGNGQTRTPHPMAQALVGDFPEVEKAVSISPVWGPGLTWAKFSVRYNDKKFEENKIFSADSNFFDVFTFKAISGDPGKAIRQVGSIIITKSIAFKYFGDDNPINQTLIINENSPLIVKAVIEDIPENSHFNFDFLISYLTLKPTETSNYYTWADFGHYNYIVLKKGTDYKSVESKIPMWSKKYIDYSIPDLKSDQDISLNLKLQPLSEIHLYSNLRWELGENGNIIYVYILMASAILILLIACINFANISVAKSIKRIKEISVRKVLGAERNDLLFQFLGEGILLSFISTLLLGLMIYMLFPLFNSFINKSFSLSQYSIWEIGSGFLIITLLVGLVSGSYPALILSSIKISSGFKNNIGKSGFLARLRKSLVVFQFGISIFLIAATLLINSQLDFIKNKNLGFNKNQIMIVPLKDSEARNKFKTLKESLQKHTQIVSISGVDNLPGGQFNVDPIRWKIENDPIHPNEMWVDYDFFKTLDLKLTDGRTFNREFISDNNAFILNQTASKGFNWSSPINEEIIWYPNDREVRGKVIGVVKDFHFKSLHQQIEPLIILLSRNNFNDMLIKFNSRDTKEIINIVKSEFSNVLPSHNFEFSFLDEYFDKAYVSEERMNTLFNIFSMVSIFLSCLGLLGLSTLAIEQKTKEIGIRKVLGASIPNIVYSLLEEYAKLTVFSAIIACPFAYYFLNNWLQNFAYRVTIEWWLFIFSGGIAFVIVLATVSYQAIKAATANPVRSIRYE